MDNTVDHSARVKGVNQNPENEENFPDKSSTEKESDTSATVMSKDLGTVEGDQFVAPTEVGSGNTVIASAEPSSKVTDAKGESAVMKQSAENMEKPSEKTFLEEKLSSPVRKEESKVLNNEGSVAVIKTPLTSAPEITCDEIERADEMKFVISESSDVSSISTEKSKPPSLENTNQSNALQPDSSISDHESMKEAVIVPEHTPSPAMVNELQNRDSLEEKLESVPEVCKSENVRDNCQDEKECSASSTVQKAASEFAPKNDNKEEDMVEGIAVSSSSEEMRPPIKIEQETSSPSKDDRSRSEAEVREQPEKFCTCDDENEPSPKGSKPDQVESVQIAELIGDKADIVANSSLDTDSKTETKQSENNLCSQIETSCTSAEIRIGSENKVENKQEESMDSGPIEKQVPVFLCDENSKDQPPQNFKPFSHYNKEGKLIDDDGSQFRIKSPVTIEDNSFPDSDAASNSIPTSSGPASRVNTPSKFQGQFMDFLKCTDDATVHSIANNEAQIETIKVGASENSTGDFPPDETSQTPSERGRKARRRKGVDDNSQSVTFDTNTNMSEKRSSRKRKTKEADKSLDESRTEDSNKGDTPGVQNEFPPENLFEYQWPQDEKNAEWFFLQEQCSAYLQVKSFKRKYPELVRRTVGIDERNFLAESGIVSEMQCDLGLMALKSDQVYNLMSKEYPEKYQAYAEILHARERERTTEKNKAQAELAKMDKSHINDLVKKAIKSAADFNAQFMREKREERRAYFDLQTYEIHYPIGAIKKLPPEATKPSSYPVALIPGQYQDYFKRYTSQQLRYFPVSTATYDPPRHLKTIYADPSDKYESELDSQSASSQGDVQDASSSSGSSSGSSSESESENSEVEEVVEPTPAPPSTKKSARTPKSKKAAAPKPDANAVCHNCQGNAEANKIGEAEELVKCSECGRHGHPSCLELTEEMIPNIKTYPWQCMECKTCVECMDPYDEDKMMFCDHCDRGYHTFCVGLRSIPTGRWECPSCRPDPPTKRRRR